MFYSKKIKRKLILFSYRKFQFNLFYRSLYTLYNSLYSNIFNFILALKKKYISFLVTNTFNYISYTLVDKFSYSLWSILFTNLIGCYRSNIVLTYNISKNNLINNIYYNSLLKNYSNYYELLNVICNNLSIKPLCLPINKSIYTVLRSPHTDKKSREQFAYKTKKSILEFDSLSIQKIINIYSILLPSYIMLRWKF